MSRALPLAGNRALLEQGLALLAAMSDAQYGAVGPHYRHALDHYLAFFKGLAEDRIDYDAREREALLEHSREAASEVTRSCLGALEALAAQPDRPLQVRMDTEIGGEPDWRASSLGRELQFLCNHTVHHYALIRLLSGPALSLAPEFGVAPSTLAYQRSSER